jgi:translation initiation factor IF-2
LKVQNLARELKKTTRELIVELQQYGIIVKSGNTKLDDLEIAQVRELVLNKKNVSNNLAADVNNGNPELILKEPTINIHSLALKLKVNLPDIMKVVLNMGLLLNLNSEVTANIAVEIAKQCGVELKFQEETKLNKISNIKSKLEKIEEAELEGNLDQLVERSAVVTILGHVDHGKTALLDAIRKSNIIAKEAGQITQHIGAYQVEFKGKKITFLDTPGHAAFTSLRARGAQITDIAILVVAADEGIKPQTVEALNHAKAANVEIIVAINKVDKPDADIENVKQQLTQYGLVAEEWGGKTIIMPISAKTKQGINELLEMIIIVSDMMELKANPTGPAKGVIIESRLSKSKGPVATILIKSGTLKVGDAFVAGTVYGKVRALLNDWGKIIAGSGPGTPVEILGLANVPSPGDILEVYANEKEAKALAEARSFVKQENKLTQKISLETISEQIEEGKVKKLNLIFKADVNGSLEAIVKLINDIKDKEVTISIIHSGTGPVNENDIMLAKASNAIIIGFGVNVNNEAQKIADAEGIEIKLYKIIYKIIDDLLKVLDGLFKAEFEEVEIGKAEVRQLFSFSKVGVIIGSFIISGKVIRNSITRIFRGKQEIFNGKINSLKRFKEDVKEITQGYECGIVIDDIQDVKEGDIIVCYELKEKNR